jgi:hypothetical protein
VADVALLDFAGPPPGTDATGWSVRSKRSRDAGWRAFKAENDPPGLQVRTLGSGWVFHLRLLIAPGPGIKTVLDNNGTPFPDIERARAAAWRWYEARVELYNILRKLNPPREFWPLILTWSDGEWIEVHSFLVQNADVIALGAADTLEFPQVLRG